VSIKNYLDNISDKDLIEVIEDDWDNIRDFCILLTLDLQLLEQEGPPQNLLN